MPAEAEAEGQCDFDLDQFGIDPEGGLWEGDPRPAVWTVAFVTAEYAEDRTLLVLGQPDQIEICDPCLADWISNPDNRATLHNVVMARIGVNPA